MRGYISYLNLFDIGRMLYSNLWPASGWNFCHVFYVRDFVWLSNYECPDCDDSAKKHEYEPEERMINYIARSSAFMIDTWS